MAVIPGHEETNKSRQESNAMVQSRTVSNPSKWWNYFFGSAD